MLLTGLYCYLATIPYAYVNLPLLHYCYYISCVCMSVCTINLLDRSSSVAEWDLESGAWICFFRRLPSSPPGQSRDCGSQWTSPSHAKSHGHWDASISGRMWSIDWVYCAGYSFLFSAQWRYISLFQVKSAACPTDNNIYINALQLPSHFLLVQ